MTTSVQPDSQEYQPSPSQMERAAALQRFNRLYVYLPLAVFSLLVVLLVVLMLWGVFVPDSAGMRAFVSGLADLVMILTVIPLLLLCAIVPAAAIGLVAYRRQQPQREYGRFQTLMWRLDTLITQARQKTADTTPKVAAPIAQGYAWIAYVRALLENLKKLFVRR